MSKNQNERDELIRAKMAAGLTRDQATEVVNNQEAHDADLEAAAEKAAKAERAAKAENKKNKNQEEPAPAQ